MKYILTFLILLSNNNIFGQTSKYLSISSIELNILTDLSATIDTSISFVVSPLVIFDFYNTPNFRSEIVTKKGFGENQFKNFSKDTFLLKESKYFELINTDSLISYQKKTEKFYLENRGREDVDIFADLVLKYIEIHYQKKALCTFFKPIIAKNKKYAIASYYKNCGFMCGSGETLLLKKKKGKWIVIEILSIIQS